MSIKKLQSQCQHDELGRPLMSRDEAQHVVERYEEIVKGRTLIPEGWVGWQLEFFLGRYDRVNVDVDVNAISPDSSKRLHSMIMVYREPPERLQKMIQRFQIGAASFGPLPFPFDQSFVNLPLAILPDKFIDQIVRDLQDPSLRIHGDARQRIRDTLPRTGI